MWVLIWCGYGLVGVGAYIIKKPDVPKSLILLLWREE